MSDDNFYARMLGADASPAEPPGEAAAPRVERSEPGAASAQPAGPLPSAVAGPAAGGEREAPVSPPAPVGGAAAGQPPRPTPREVPPQDSGQPAGALVAGNVNPQGRRWGQPATAVAAPQRPAPPMTATSGTPQQPRPPEAFPRSAPPPTRPSALIPRSGPPRPPGPVATDVPGATASRAPQGVARPAAPAVASPSVSAGGSGEPARAASASVGRLRADIRAADLVKPYKEVPEKGWRKGVYRTTRINFGLSPSERAWHDLRQRVARNLRGTYLVAVLNEKGGVGKTSVTVALGSALARYRDDKIVGIDGNRARGNLAERIEDPSQGTWRGLIADQRLDSYSDYRHYLGKNSAGFEVLAGDPGDQVLDAADVVELWRRLQRQYPVGLIDCGNQMRDEVMASVLQMADAMVVVSTTRLDGVQGATRTLNWLVDHGYPHLVRQAVVVISDIGKVSSGHADKLHEQFGKAVRAVHFVPFDPHLSDATPINFDRLKPKTRRAFIEAAASLVDGFSSAADKDAGAAGGPRGRGRNR